MAYEASPWWIWAGELVLLLSGIFWNWRLYIVVLHYMGYKTLSPNRLKYWLTNKEFLLPCPWTIKVSKIFSEYNFQRTFIFHKAQTFRLQFLVKLNSSFSRKLMGKIYSKLYEFYGEFPGNIQFLQEYLLNWQFKASI